MDAIERDNPSLKGVLPKQLALLDAIEQPPDAAPTIDHCATCGDRVPNNGDWPHVSSDRSRYCGAD
jgi:hypothetical protein